MDGNQDECRWCAFVGDFSVFDVALQKKPVRSLWIVPMFLNAFFRGIGQVVFCNNPFSGLLTLIALFVSNVDVAIAAVVATTTAILTSVLLKQPRSEISAGLTLYNSVIVGCVPVALLPYSYRLWIFVVLGSVVSVIFTKAFANIFSSFTVPLPCLSLPFNAVSIIIFVVNLTPPEHSTSTAVFSNVTSDISWISLLRGGFNSMSQVYAVEDTVASALMYLAILVYSPLLCIMSLLGGLVGTFAAVLVSAPPYDALYAGVWGYNGLLSAGAAGVFFVVPTFRSFCIAMLDVLWCVCLQGAMHVMFKPYPVLSFPFLFTTLIFLSLTSSSASWRRVKAITFPERHRYEFLRDSSRRTRRSADENEPTEIAL